MLPLIRPDIAFDEVAEDFKTILASGMLTRGPYLARFEAAVAAYAGVQYAFATTSATTALHLVLAGADIGRDDEVLVSDFTFPASGNAIVQCGATPVLVDCKPGSFALDLADAERKITPRTRALMVVHPFGQPVDFEALEAFATRHRLLLIEDAACALGAQRQGRRAGSLMGAGCYSFHPRKVVTTGEGGMVTTHDGRLAERMEILRSHGSVADAGGLRFELNGFNYRMSELQAAMGISQMAKVDEIINDRRRTARLYCELLGADNRLQIPLEASADECTFQSFVVMLHGSIVRDEVIKAMRARGIETTIGTYAMHAHPAFARFGYTAGDLPHSYAAQQHALTLPLLPRMNPDSVRQVVAALTDCLSEHSR